jgi:hypothetical protein
MSTSADRNDRAKSFLARCLPQALRRHFEKRGTALSNLLVKELRMGSAAFVRNEARRYRLQSARW